MGSARRFVVAAFLCAALFAAACLSACAFANDASHFTGTWDLRWGHSSQGDDSLSEQNVAGMRELGLDAYLNLDEDGSLVLVTFDKAMHGDWKATGSSTANATIEGRSAEIQLEGEELRLTQQDTMLVFGKGAPKDDERAGAVQQDGSQQDGAESGADQGAKQEKREESAGLSELVMKGALLDEPITMIDGEYCTVVVDGVGVDKLGDPGYNLQITNNYDTSIDVWVLDSFSVAGAPVRVYLFQTVDPGKSATAFMQFDTQDLGSVSPTALVDVSGIILIDDDADTTIAEYPFKM